MKHTARRLGALCAIKTGVPINRAKRIAEGVEPSEVNVLLPRAMQDGSIIDDRLATETIGVVKGEGFTREGDVVIKLSTPYDSVCIDRGHEGILVTSSAMVVRTLPDVELDMQYLSMFLNLPQTNSVLQAVSTGQSAALAMLKRKTVADIEIPLLPLDRQQMLASLFRLVQKRRRRYARLIDLDAELVTRQMAEAIWEEEG